MDIYERMKAGEWIDMRTDEDYKNIAGGTTASYWYGDLQYLKQTH